MDSKHLMGSAPIDTPESALAMYEADERLGMAHWPARVHWSHDLGEALLRQFRDLKDMWQFDTVPDAAWNRPRPFRTESDKPALEGNCNDFAPALLLRWQALGVPRGALRLVVCKFDGKGHMVLAIDTTRGTLIACNISGVWDHEDPSWKHYEWHSWEAHLKGPLGWESLEPISLAAALG